MKRTLFCLTLLVLAGCSTAGDPAVEGPADSQQAGRALVDSLEAVAARGWPSDLPLGTSGKPVVRVHRIVNRSRYKLDVRELETLLGTQLAGSGALGGVASSLGGSERVGLVINGEISGDPPVLNLQAVNTADRGTVAVGSGPIAFTAPSEQDEEVDDQDFDDEDVDDEDFDQAKPAEPPAPKEPEGEPAVSEGWQAQVLLTRDDVWYVRLLSVTNPEGKVFEVEIDKTWREPTPGSTLFALSWQEPGWSLQIREEGKPGGLAFVFRDGLRVAYDGYRAPTLLDPAEAKPMTAELLERLACLPERARREGLRVLQLEGSHGGAKKRDFVLDDPGVLIVLAPDYTNHGQVISRGPILALGGVRTVATTSWVFYDEESRPRAQPLAEAVFTIRDHGTRTLSRPATQVRRQ